MKICVGPCGRRLDDSSFNRRTASADGLQPYCRECQSAHATSPVGRRSRANYSQANREAELQAKRAWNRKHWRARDADRLNAGRRAYIARNPEKHAAHNAVFRAVRRGDLVRPATCSRCGCSCKPHAHHHDYSKPLEVEWLCYRCHRGEHNDKLTG